jgi:Erv1 / Alr family
LLAVLAISKNDDGRGGGFITIICRELVMDTRFWGPSGWQLLHLIAQEYPDDADGRTKRRYELFFNSIKDILPCKFCRESTSNFMAHEEYALHPALKSKRDLTFWLYKLHNRVNKKLRDQCAEDSRIICPPADPTYEEIFKLYDELIHIKQPNIPPGIDFLYCVVYNYPKAKEDITSDKIRAYFEFFMNMYDVYPYKHLRKVIQEFVDVHIVYDALQSRTALMNWFQNMMKAVARETGNIKILPSWNKISYYASGCNKKSYHGKTCRNGKRVRNHKKTFKITHSRLIALK